MFNTNRVLIDGPTCLSRSAEPSSSTLRHRAKPAPDTVPQARRERFDFAAVNAAALAALPVLLARWLPDGCVEGREYVARNPRRPDRHRGSFKVNLRTGRWADFATQERGGDAVSLTAYLFGLTQVEAGRRLAGALGLPERRLHHG